MMPARRLALALLSALAAVCAPAFAHDDWMSESAMRATFGGVAVDGHYANGRTFEERFAADGRIEYRERGFFLPGRWSVTAGTFCTIYDHDPTGGCYRVRMVGANCYEFYFVARTEDDARMPDTGPPSWTARAWVKDRKSTCAEGANV